MKVVIQLFLFDLEKCENTIERYLKEYRLMEYLNVLLKNVNDKHIEEIHILLDTERAFDFYKNTTNTFPNKEKLKFILHGHQPTYKEIMEYIKNTFKENELICLMNSDIFFNSENDHLLIKKYLQKNHLFALTRHEITDEGHTIHNLETCPFTEFGGSCDTYIFYTPLQENLDLSKMDFLQNNFGAEAVFMKFWVDAGYELWNPCYDIITLHLHRGRTHFSNYSYINNEFNSVSNSRTPLPPIPLYICTPDILGHYCQTHIPDQ